MMREGIYDDAHVGGGNQEDDNINVLDFEEVQGPLSQWLKKRDVIRFINNQINNFFRNFKNSDEIYVYEEKINDMC